MNLAHYTKGIEDVAETARKQTVMLADVFRSQVLIPLCSKHKLTFLSGNGTFAFFRKDESVFPEDLPTESQSVLEVLNTPCFDRFEFGLFVSDVKESDLRIRKTTRKGK